MTSPSAQQVIDFAIKWSIPVLLSWGAVWIAYRIILYLAKQEIGEIKAGQDAPRHASSHCVIDGGLLFWIMNSAWGRWQSAQPVKDNRKPLGEWHMQSLARNSIQAHAENGNLKIRGRRKNSLQYEAIPSDFWKSVVLDFKEDEITKQRFFLRLKDGANPSLSKQIPEYEVLEASWKNIEELWPTKDKKLDAETAKLLSVKLNLLQPVPLIIMALLVGLLIVCILLYNSPPSPASTDCTSFLDVETNNSGRDGYYSKGGVPCGKVRAKGNARDGVHIEK